MKYFRSTPESEFGNHLNACKADDTPIPFVGFACQKCMEVYSGDVDGDFFEPDETPEEVRGDVQWSIMWARTANDYGFGPVPRLAYSIEEANTSDFESVPSREE